MITAALLGNPNVGKTTLFNALTGANQYVGNWAGVTIEKKEGFFGKNVKIVDLPGIYAMDTYSNEEKISKEFLQRDDVDVVINIVDASNLSRNLYLTFQLRQFNKPVVLVLNMMDVAKAKGIEIDCDKLSKRLGVTVIPISATKKTGINKLKEVLENSNFFTSLIDNDCQLDNEADIYRHIEEILKECTRTTGGDTITPTERIDKLVLNKYLAYPFFILVMYLIFQFTFSWVGQPLSDMLDMLVNDYLVPWVGSLLSDSNEWFQSLIIDGIMGGVGSVIVFLPVILTLFLGISFLEDSGYMARAAFLMDKIMRRMGLSGKAFIPMMVGFGCSVPGIMSTRTLESEKDRKLTALLVPLMSCNAKLPVYVLLASVFFPGKQTLIIFSLYLLGIAMAFIVGWIFDKTIFKKDEEPFIIELPEYKMPEMRDLLIHTWRKGESFLKKMGTVIFAASVIIWFLSSFNFSGLADINDSFLSYLGKAINPIFIPLGFGTWQNSVSLLTGIVAKEVVVGSMGVLYGGDLKSILPGFFNPLSAYAFLVFVLLYTPCISTVAAVKKEYGGKMMALSIVYQILLAWVVAFIVYSLGNLILGIV
ncbi:ferrous iron transport protein B [Clostridium thermosuccinogenes]|uniref:Ferrous iron transport protein B n=1 Tax=Clostridium thermosuccinogenes TaxID=84032 RepID=A0A2K2FFS8_9CLOT|nr:ferrous iron transport protein B [Pseudoclostridium thermosuccinogenes]AUS96710.1 ferrous iron transport protein B [Pseudoclostridium thermosuccinogenes]PNT97634.1 ferrous iron transport protein B [Pseudoclostridium thermosuccinogenes]PNU00527.1 ferrous iron transport protein B [Pseudoclostridium thermosuccinogenes]